MKEREIIERLLNTVRLVRDLMRESDGVAGYHADGTVMAWEEWEDLTPDTVQELIARAERELSL